MLTPAMRSRLAFAVDFVRRNRPLSRMAQRWLRPDDPWAHNKGNPEFEALRRQYGRSFPRIGERPERRLLALVASDEETRAYFRSACDELGIVPLILDGLDGDLIERLAEARPWGVFFRPPHHVALWRSVYEERLDCIERQLGIPVYPGRTELSVYENKRCLAYFLAGDGIPHPPTRVLFRREEALRAVASASYPLIFKTATGSAASGVEILHDRFAAARLVKLVFDRFYIGRDYRDSRDADWGYAILQDFVRDAREFRIIQIGDSWFGHEKSKSPEQAFMSGSGSNEWTPPPFDLLNFCRDISQRHSFRTMCFDVFRAGSGEYLVNELQTWFGSYNPSQMYIDGVPGRYRKTDQGWEFERGLFNVHGGMLLRILDFHEHLHAAAGK